jgi:hypothetical protein
MKPSELFGVFVRTVGFLIILYSLYDVLSGFDYFIENLISGGQDSESGSTSILTYFVFGIPEFIVGVLLFFLADWVVKLAYRDASS